MPDVPFIFSGTVTDIDQSTVLSGVKVTALNKTNTGNTSVVTDSNGQYVLDFANMANNVSVGDVVSLKYNKGSKTRVSDVTITQAMIDSGGRSLGS